MKNMRWLWKILLNLEILIVFLLLKELICHYVQLLNNGFRDYWLILVDTVIVYKFGLSNFLNFFL